jgi:surfactin family lipopeptide synthetase A
MTGKTHTLEPGSGVVPGRDAQRGLGVVRGKRPERLPLSYGQQRLWFIDRLQGSSTEYNMPQALRLRGELDRTALERTLQAIVERHESLRTHFSERDGEPVQEIAPALHIEVPLEDLSGLEEEERQERVAGAQRQEWKQPFDLAQGPLLRMKLLKLGEREHVLLATIHHIVADAWSQAVFNREFTVLYGANSEGRANPLKPLKVQYADFALWQRGRLDSGEMKRELSYWKEQLAGHVESLELATDRPRGAMPTAEGKRHYQRFSAEQTARLKKLSRESQATLYMTLVAGFAVLMGYYSRQDDIMIGSPIATRQEETEGLIGFFVNTLVMRVRVKAGMSFRELLGQVRKTALEALQHQEAPFERVVDEISPQRRLNMTPLFQVAFALQNAPQAALEMNGLAVEPAGTDEFQARFDLEVGAGEQAGQLGFCWAYNRWLFDPWRIEQMARHYAGMLEAVVADPERALGQIDVLSAEERQEVLVEWNRTGSGYPRDRCLHELFEEQAGRTPDAVAVTYEGCELTYAELNRQANRLARYLRGSGVKPGRRVAICVERSLEMVVGLLSILKAGGAYVPLDPAYPVERLNRILDDSDPAVLLTQGQLRGLFSEIRKTLPVLDLMDLMETAAWSHEPEMDLERAGLTPKDLAYVMYTSGSTGMPKGVMVEHGGVVNLLWFMGGILSAGSGDCMLGLTSIVFDIAGLELYLPLMVGSKVAVVAGARSYDPAALAQAVNDLGVTVMQATPATWRMLMDAGWGGARNLKALCGGEALTTELARRLGRQVGRLWNEYGPTETTIWSSYEPIDSASEEERAHVPIGRPVANTQMYILDEQGKPVAVGVTGGVYIGGAGVAQGYWKRPELTAEQFVPNPFVEEAGARMYRTGDLGRWLRDGRMEFLGRSDFQVKIRGFRIELEEIERGLAEHSGVREAVVVAHAGAAGEKTLVAYVVFRREEEVRVEELQRFLRQRLPGYMVPAVFVPLEGLPLTINGKVNRAALAEAQVVAQGAQAGFVAARTGLEKTIAGVWKEVLQIEEAGVRDSFFDLGGHSLRMVQVHSRLEQVLAHCPTVLELFEYPTIESLAAHLEQHGIPTAGQDSSRIGLIEKLKQGKNRLRERARKAQGTR